MTALERFCSANVPAAAWPAIQIWYNQFASEPCLELLRRNIDRECERQDIDVAVLADFLNQVAPLGHSHPDPCDLIDALLSPNVSRFQLAGKPLGIPPVTLYRYMRLDHWVTCNWPAGPAGQTDATVLAEFMERGSVTASVMEGTWFGKPGAAVWCTLDFLSAEESAHRIRNRLGLQGGPGERRDEYYVELRYESEWLDSKNIPIRPPTFLDACLGSLFRLREQAWVFQKNRNAGGGPDWGLTLDLTNGGPGGRGLPEAVHAAFRIGNGEGTKIGLRLVAPERLDCRKLLHNREI